eukprot:Lithocolla_globosa_v1_NODE_3345_length_1694_cov_7.418548.p1 type:complete len:348 gc:universal NODE_3345_length_1694_cov_7.418548:1627-584(-)
MCSCSEEHRSDWSNEDSRRKMKSAGRMQEGRPAQPEISTVVVRMFLENLRGAALATLFTYAIQKWYLKIACKFSTRQKVFFTMVITFIHSSLYFVLNSFFLASDKFHWLDKYKLPRKESQQPSKSLLWKTILTQVVSQFLVTPIFLLKKGGADLFFKNNSYQCHSPLPSNPLLVFAWFSGSAFFNDFGFYATHRTMHEVPFLYKHIHKQHHEYVGTVGFAAEYSHPLEGIMSNILPTIGFPFLMKIHPLAFFVWLAWRLEETYEGHSGYCFLETTAGQWGLLNGFKSAFHDYHHTRNKGNFGAPFVDMLLQTQDFWLRDGKVEGQWTLKKKLEEKLLAAHQKEQREE